jgi:hypothetical protein
MADARIPFDADIAPDFYLDAESQTKSLGDVLISRVVLTDALENYRAQIFSDRALSVRITRPDGRPVDSTSNGSTGSTPSPATVNTASSTVLAAGTTRRAVWLTNPSTSAADVIWLRLGGGTAVLNQGVPLYPGGTICFDRSPNMAITGISAGATGLPVAIGIEVD